MNDRWRDPTDPPIERSAWLDVDSSFERAARARELRRMMTPTERSFWECVRGHRFLGIKWRRGHPIGPFHVDFYCHPWRLGVEFDGPVHDDTVERDEERDAFLAHQGITIVRVKNEVWADAPRVVLAWLALAFARGTDGSANTYVEQQRSRPRRRRSCDDPRSGRSGGGPIHE